MKPAQKWSKKQVKFYKKQNPVVEIAAGCVMWAIPILPYGVIDPLDIAGTVLFVDGGRRIRMIGIERGEVSVKARVKCSKVVVIYDCCFRIFFIY